MPFGDVEAEAGGQGAAGARRSEPTVSVCHLTLARDWFSFPLSFPFPKRTPTANRVIVYGHGTPRMCPVSSQIEK